MSECQEPKCTYPATKVWGGRNVCQDHFEQYKDQQEKMLMELNEV